MADYRTRAPGRASDQPDYFVSLSGGIDSVAAMLTTIDAIETTQAGGNFIKKPVAIYLDTRTGAPLNRIYCEQLCDYLDVQLWTLRTDEKFEDWLRRDGAPGSAAHPEVRNELKDRQVSKLISLADNPVMILGISADESQTRAGFDKVREMRRHTEVYPVHRLSRRDRAEIILRSDAPRNPLWLEPAAIKDCGCLCNGDPSELEITDDLFPQFVQRLREWEEAIEHDGLKGTLGWSGLTADEKSAKRDGLNQATLPICSSGCSRNRDPPVVEAFRADAEGAPLDECLNILRP
jgi:3'-phosphoadenosine 5'-phosphosulfate sulfotransferase (PAPS reductase)/FAD synthetase